MTKELKVCPKCHLELPIADFVIVNKARGYRRAHCRTCESARVRAYYASNETYRAKVRETAEKNRGKYPRTSAQQRMTLLKGKYGISPEQYETLLLSQEGRCALCKGASPGRNRPDKKWKSGHWNVDHCHANGHVRGLLCHTCNTRLGSYEALMKEIGEAAVLDYLTRPSPVLPITVVAKPPPRFVEVLPLKPVFAPKPCSVDGCSKGTTARGFCPRHYARFLRRNGDVGGAEQLPHNGPRGTSHHLSKLTEEIVREIRTSDATGIALAAKFGVTTTLVSNVRLRKVWKDVN